MNNKHSIEIVSFTIAMHLLAWINHFALNTASAIASVFYALVPPQWTGHNKHDLVHLANGNPVSWFASGLTDSKPREEHMRRLTLEEKDLIVYALKTASMAWQGKAIFDVEEKSLALRAIVLRRAISDGKINIED